jgi:hypothetical protein
MKADMKNIVRLGITMIIAWCVQSPICFAQKIDEERMKRDIEVGENVLATLIKQEINQQRTFFALGVKGSYQPGYGVTFRLPGEGTISFFRFGPDNVPAPEPVVGVDGSGYRFSYRTDGSAAPDRSMDEKEAFKLADKSVNKERLRADSARTDFNKRLIKAAQDFILDYGDFISQLAPDEKIIVTNQGDRHHVYFNSGKRTRISVEGTKADITALKMGKLTRDQALKKLELVNTESVEVKEPDMEMLSSIFSRLYRSDLSKTYFTESNVYYERLKDYGTIFYMQMVSSVETDYGKFSIPTIGADNLDQRARDKKVTELYPDFEKDLKDNILEYGRSLKNLKDNEVLVFNVAMTKCLQCGIPSSLELSIKSSVLKDFASGKTDKGDALDKFQVKKGANQ